MSGFGLPQGLATTPAAPAAPHRTPKPLLEERWHGEAVAERCWGSCDSRKSSA